jgi:hypothetical protein
MEAPSLRWVSSSCKTFNSRRCISHLKVDLGGSLAVASRGLYATGVSTDLNGKYDLQGSIGLDIRLTIFSHVSQLWWQSGG